MLVTCAISNSVYQSFLAGLRMGTVSRKKKTLFPSREKTLYSLKPERSVTATPVGNVYEAGNAFIYLEDFRDFCR